MIVHADHAGPYLAKCVTEDMDHNSLKMAPHSPYSPDFAPYEFYPFGHVKHQLQGHEFTEGADLISAISEILSQIPTDTSVDVFDD
jgi:transposase